MRDYLTKYMAAIVHAMMLGDTMAVYVYSRMLARVAMREQADIVRVMARTLHNNGRYSWAESHELAYEIVNVR